MAPRKRDWLKILRPARSERSTSPDDRNNKPNESQSKADIIHPAPATAPTDLPQCLWNQAYDHIKETEPETLDAYEKILSQKLSTRSDNGGDPERQSNDVVQQDSKDRWIQMRELVTLGLKRTEKAVAAWTGLEDTVKAVLAAKDLVTTAVQASPQAAVAWVGVCFALEILLNPGAQDRSNREGLKYVISMIDWYWNLSALLLEQNIAESHAGLQNELRNLLVELYVKLLLYQMKSLCLYNRTRLTSFARGSLKLDDWDGKVNEIKAAELRVNSASEQYNTLQIRAHLRDIAEAGRHQDLQLQAIDLSIQDQTQRIENAQEKKEDNKCLADLCLRDPRHEKTRIEHAKGGLLTDSYQWILENEDYHSWYHEKGGSLLWISGDPGQGKTMLLCGLINELQNASLNDTKTVAYFLCEATDSSINNGTSVLRGLIYVLLIQRPTLVHHVRDKYDQRGRSLFEDPSAWFALAEILKSILRDPSLGPTFLLVDALDECLSDRDKLLNLMFETSSFSVKWVASSRKWEDIEKQMKRAERKVCIYLSPTADFMLAAVNTYIKYKVDHMAGENDYTDKTKDMVFDYLSSNANGTFLWVALVCQNIADVDDDEILNKLHQFPAGLDNLYDRIVSQIQLSDHWPVCLQVLATMCVLKRPVSVTELAYLVESLEQHLGNQRTITKIVERCRSYLVIRMGKIYFVHQSAQDYLSQNFSHIFSLQKEEMHYKIFSKSLELLNRLLQRDMYHLRDPGSHTDNIPKQTPDPLEPVAYACLYWIDHLIDSRVEAHYHEYFTTKGVEAIQEFVQKKLLNWFEALSLLRGISLGIQSLRKLASHSLWEEKCRRPRHDQSPRALEHPIDSDLLALVHDASRFLRYYREVIELHPLQVYASALLFSPRTSNVRKLFEANLPGWIKTATTTRDQWGPCVMTLALPTNRPHLHYAVFSPDGRILAVFGRYSQELILWDVETGAMLSTIRTLITYDSSEFRFEFSNVEYRRAAFTVDGQFVVAIHGDNLARLWSTKTWVMENEIDLRAEGFLAWAVSPRGRYIIFFTGTDRFSRFFNVASTQQTDLPFRIDDESTKVSFSLNEQTIAVSGNIRVDVWNIDQEALLYTLPHSLPGCNIMRFLSNGKTLAMSGNKDATIELWDVVTATKTTLWDRRLKNEVERAELSPDCRTLVKLLKNGSVEFWDTCQDLLLGKMNRYLEPDLGSVAFAPNGTDIILSDLGTLRVWSRTTCSQVCTIDSNAEINYEIGFHPGSSSIVSISLSNMVFFWDMKQAQLGLTGESTHKGEKVICVWIAPPSPRTSLVALEYETRIAIWNFDTGKVISSIEGYYDEISQLKFLSAGEKLVTIHPKSATVKLWDAGTGKLLGEWMIPKLNVDLSSYRLISFLGSNETIAFIDVTTRLLYLIDMTNIPSQSKCFNVDGLIEPRTITTSKQKLAFFRGQSIEVWDSASCEMQTRLSILHQADENNSARNIIAIASDEDLLASVFYSKSNKIQLQVWEIGSGRVQLLKEVNNEGDSVSMLEFSPKGDILASVMNSKECENVIDIWDTQLGAHKKKLTGRKGFLIRDFTFSSNAKSMLVSYESDLYVWGGEIWNLDTGTLLHIVSPKRSCRYKAFSSDDSLLQTNRGIIWDNQSTDKAPLGLVVTNEWVFLGQRKLLWLPPEFYTFDDIFVCGSTITIVCRKDIIRIEIDLEKAADTLGVEHVPERYISPLW